MQRSIAKLHLMSRVRFQCMTRFVGDAALFCASSIASSGIPSEVELFRPRFLLGTSRSGTGSHISINFWVTLCVRCVSVGSWRAGSGPVSHHPRCPMHGARRANPCRHLPSCRSSCLRVSGCQSSNGCPYRCGWCLACSALALHQLETCHLFRSGPQSRHHGERC